MAIDFNWFIKITRSFGSGFQSQNIARPKVRLIMMRTDLSKHSYQIRLRNILVCELATHSVTIVFFLYVDIMFIVYNVSGTIGLTFPGRRHYFLIFLFLFLRRGIYYCCMLPLWVMLTHGFFPFQHPLDLRTVSTPVRLVSLQRCADLRFVLLSEVL